LPSGFPASSTTPPAIAAHYDTLTALAGPRELVDAREAPRPRDRPCCPHTDLTGAIWDRPRLGRGRRLPKLRRAAQQLCLLRRGARMAWLLRPPVPHEETWPCGFFASRCLLQYLSLLRRDSAGARSLHEQVQGVHFQQQGDDRRHPRVGAGLLQGRRRPPTIDFDKLTKQASNSARIVRPIPKSA
jgi:hypothetical protein